MAEKRKSEVSIKRTPKETKQITDYLCSNGMAPNDTLENIDAYINYVPKNSMISYTSAIDSNHDPAKHSIPAVPNVPFTAFLHKNDLNMEEHKITTVWVYAKKLTMTRYKLLASQYETAGQPTYSKTPEVINPSEFFSDFVPVTVSIERFTGEDNLKFYNISDTKDIISENIHLCDSSNNYDHYIPSNAFQSEIVDQDDY